MKSGGKVKNKLAVSRKNMMTYVFILIATIMVGTCIIMFIQVFRLDSYHKIYDERWTDKNMELITNFAEIDTLNLAKVYANELAIKDTLNNSHSRKTAATADTVWKPLIGKYYILTDKDAQLIIESQKCLMARQDAMVQDLRQESNNIINKMNGWLGFWIGVLALLGVFVPISLQFRLKQNADSQADELKNKCDDIEKDLTTKEKDIKNRINETIGNFQKEKNLLEFTSLVRNFQYVFETPEMQTNEYRRGVLVRIWQRIIPRLHEFISNYSKNNRDVDVIHELTIGLVMTANVLTLMLRMAPRRIRHLNKMIDDTMRLISDLNSPASNRAELSIRLDDYYDNLRILPIPA